MTWIAALEKDTAAEIRFRDSAAPFDLLCRFAFNAPVLTRRQHAYRVKKQQAAFFHYYQPEVCESRACHHLDN